ncbi:hypothetical protein [Arthrobacter sp. S41]|uniref:hypothetical protein n=1 Tax=Arthrobacter sp. S41 TaxID=2509721 RepID=UPI0010367E32|nr:hypothetical protein [Arthrobacter sp. S41]TAP25814.1 hypothetical protein EYR88_12705 [Arthrobacter sp. S41]
MTTTNYSPSIDQRSSTTSHEHFWEVQSSHQTSQGIVQYLQCHDCRTHQVRQLGLSAQTTLASKELRA